MKYQRHDGDLFMSRPECLSQSGSRILERSNDCCRTSFFAVNVGSRTHVESCCLTSTKGTELLADSRIVRRVFPFGVHLAFRQSQDRINKSLQNHDERFLVVAIVELSAQFSNSNAPILRIFAESYENHQTSIDVGSLVPDGCSECC